MEQQIRITRIQGDQLEFLISFDPGNDVGDSITLPYKAFQQVIYLGKEFMQSCMCTEIIQRWEP